MRIAAIILCTAVCTSYGFVDFALDIPEVPPTQETGRSALISAIMHVESRCNDKAYRKSENAAGCLQIRPIMVREVNRILKMCGSQKRFSLQDRWDRGKSIEMFNIYTDYHHPSADNETIARSWNGGPKGHKKNSTIKYWKKVKHKLTNI